MRNDANESTLWRFFISESMKYTSCVYLYMSDMDFTNPFHFRTHGDALIMFPWKTVRQKYMGHFCNLTNVK